MKLNWWHGKIAYQIYPKSFKDSNGDGIGDLKGIITKLEYLKDLGVDIIWLSPIYVSPFVDNGYDIADYRNIAPVFGSMEDFDELLAKAKKLDLHIILDLVVNHCSSEHELFKKALKNPEGEEASYFYFVKGKDGKTPDNLRSYFGGSVWEKVEGYDDLYYLHYYAKEQPDLNWNNPVLVQKVYDMINWWLDKGISGFRVDAIMNVAKDLSFPGLPADDIDGLCAANKMTGKLTPKVPAMLNELKKNTFDKYNALTVAEAFGVKDEVLPKLYGENGCFSTLFDFSARELYESLPGYYAFPHSTVKHYRDHNFATQKKVGQTGFICPILENHDEPRSVSLYLKPHQQNADGAKSLATAFMFLRGLPFIFQGQELGMTNTHFDSLDEFKDLLSVDEYKKCLAHGLTDAQALEALNNHARDNARTPMLWDDSDNAGFSTGTPWMKVHQDYKKLNVKTQLQDPSSVLNYYKKLTALRKRDDLLECFTYGRFDEIDMHSDEVIAYSRTSDDKKIGIFANFKDEVLEISLSENDELLLQSSDNVCIKDHKLVLGPCSAAVVNLQI